MKQEQWQRYIDNVTTPEEKKVLLQWLQQVNWEQELAESWETEVPPMPQEVSARLLEALITHAAFCKPARRWRLRLWWSAAASLLLLVGGLAWWTLRPPRQQNNIVKTQVLQNNSMQVHLVTLPEGSQVWLAPGSLLTIPGDFNTGTRRLELNGEAYFEVTHNPQVPFLVKAGSLQTTVLGTHFNIEAYKKEPDIKVSLTSGKVAVKYTTKSGGDSTRLLLPGTRIVYNTALRASTLEHFSQDAEVAWQRGALVFDNIPLSDVFQRLENRFGKKIIYTHIRPEKKFFTATYEEASLDVILRNITFIYGLHYQIKGDTITIN